MLQIPRSFLSSAASSSKIAAQTHWPKSERGERAYLVAVGARFGAGASRRDSVGDPAAIHRLLDPTIILVPDCEGSKEERCELTRTPYGRRFVCEC